MPKVCPICLAKYDRVDLSENVCNYHQNWFVITCTECHKTSFSNSVGLCLSCSSGHYKYSFTRGSGDHRWILSYYGLEKYNG